MSPRRRRRDIYERIVGRSLAGVRGDIADSAARFAAAAAEALAWAEGRDGATPDAIWRRVARRLGVGRRGGWDSAIEGAMATAIKDVLDRGVALGVARAKSQVGRRVGRAIPSGEAVADAWDAVVSARAEWLARKMADDILARARRAVQSTFRRTEDGGLSILSAAVPLAERAGAEADAARVMERIITGTVGRAIETEAVAGTTAGQLGAASYGAEEAGVTLAKVWQTEEDRAVCDVCSEHSREPVELDARYVGGEVTLRPVERSDAGKARSRKSTERSPMRPVRGGEAIEESPLSPQWLMVWREETEEGPETRVKRMILGPPAHPNCRCTLAIVEL